MKGALYSWQYLFIIEGAVPIVLGMIAPFWLAKNVNSAWYLKEDEREFGQKRMIIDSAANFGGGQLRIKPRDFKEAFMDWRVWSSMLSNMLASLSSQGFTIFFPVVVKVGTIGSDVSRPRLHHRVSGTRVLWRT